MAMAAKCLSIWRLVCCIIWIMPRFYDFFAGAGLVSLGLNSDWQPLLALDVDRRKAAIYSQNIGGQHLLVKDIHSVSSSEISGYADLAWASFPCQDLSLGGATLAQTMV
ncbi:MAG: DNA cytosine methyltransferase [Gloeomargarita sp. SKYG98]|nr:DNA cytosine methyltransferase [Gloeomargarita sp. SKYG98]